MNVGLLALDAAESASWFVVVLGVAIVFVGLVAIIGLCELMNLIYDKVTANKTEAASAEAAPVAAPAAPAVIPNRQEFIAAVSAALAEELGEDISAIRILSVRKL